MSGYLIDDDLLTRMRSVIAWVESVRQSTPRSVIGQEPVEPQLLKFTGTTATSGTATIQGYDGSTFATNGDTSGVSLTTMNGEYLKQDSYYPAFRIGPNSVFVACPGAIRVGAYYGVYRLSFTGSGFTVTETTAGQVLVSYTETNSIIVDTYGTQTLNTDNTTGIYSTNPGGGSTTTTLHLAAATVSVWGVVNTVSQGFAGAKSFQDGIYVTTNSGSPSPVSIRAEWVAFGLDSGPALQTIPGDINLVTNLCRVGAPYTHGGVSHSGFTLSNGSAAIYRTFWDGFSSTRDNSSSYNINLYVQGNYCVDYWDGAAWQVGTGVTGTLGVGATARGGIITGTGTAVSGFTGTVP